MCLYVFLFVFRQKAAYEMRISDGSSDVCSSDLLPALSPLGRSLLRHRRDLGGRVGRALESFGSVDFVLPTADPVSGDDVAGEPDAPAPLEVPSPSPFVSLDRKSTRLNSSH